MLLILWFGLAHVTRSHHGSAGSCSERAFRPTVSVLNVKALVAAFNQEKVLVGAFSVIVQPVVEPMDRFAALVATISSGPGK